MKRGALVLFCLAVVGCQPEVIREPVSRVTLPGGLEVTWLPVTAAVEKPAAGPLVIRLRSIGEGPVVVLRLLLGGAQGASRPVVFVQDPKPGAFRYEPSSDCIVAEAAGGSPFHLAPAFRWYEMVLHPGAGTVRLELPLTEVTFPVQLLVDHVRLSYGRLARAAYVPPEGPVPRRQGQEPSQEPDAVIRYRRASEEEMRRRRPAQLFLRTGGLPPPVRTPIEIPLSPTP